MGIPTERTLGELERHLRRRKKSNRHFVVAIFLIPIAFVLFIAGISLFGSAQEDKRPTMDNMNVLLDTTIKRSEDNLVGKSNHEYYLYTKKGKSTYRFTITEEMYNDIQDLANTNVDVMYSQDMYAEKTAVGISFSDKRR